jgi:AraC-like DNA-binding protein
MTLRRGSAPASSRSSRDATSIVAWTPRGRDQEQTLVTALGGEPHVVCCRTELELWEALAEPTVRVLVLELTLEGRPKPASLIAAVRSRYAAIRIVGYCSLTQALATEVLTCARYGLDEIALQGFGSLGCEIRRALADCKGTEEVILSDLQKMLSPTLLEMVRVLLQRLDEAPHLDQLSRLLGLSPRTLQRTASQEQCCSPSDLICAVRVLVAVRLLVLEAQPMRQVLARTGFQSTRALRVALGRCGLSSLKGLRGRAGYAAARDTVLRFIGPEKDVAGIAPVAVRVAMQCPAAPVRERISSRGRV